MRVFALASTVTALLHSPALGGSAFLPVRHDARRGRRYHGGGGSGIAGRGVPSSLATTTTTTTTRLLYDNNGDLDAARRCVRDGMTAFREGRIGDSIVLFDRAEAEEPRLDPYLWQRGLSYYYVDDFEKASAQFRRDVRVNPSDAEEIVWDIASQLRLERLRDDRASSSFPLSPTDVMTLPEGRDDRRPVMNAVYRMFRGAGDEETVARIGHDAGRSAADGFYALFYLGLFAEARDEPVKAEGYLRRAVHTPYHHAQQRRREGGRGDYMTDVARVHCQLRGWDE